jgi:probable addiction module antidote protein
MISAGVLLRREDALTIPRALNSDESISYYWLEVTDELAESSSEIAAVALGKIAYARALQQLAMDMGVAYEKLWQAVNGLEALSFEQINRAADVLGLEPINSYQAD